MLRGSSVFVQPLFRRSRDTGGTRGRLRGIGVVRAINLAERRFDFQVAQGGVGRRIGGIQGQAAGATALDRAEIKQADEGVEADSPRVAAEAASRLKGSRQHFLVKTDRNLLLDTASIRHSARSGYSRQSRSVKSRRLKPTLKSTLFANPTKRLARWRCRTG